MLVSPKELAIHDHCLANFKYDYTFGCNAHSILGPILQKSAVCEGIAKFAKLAFDYLGIKSLIVSGKAVNPVRGMTENHAWNIVKISGKTYHLDITFDMGLTDIMSRYDYFNISDADIKKDHIILSETPACDTGSSEYFSLRPLPANNFGELGSLIKGCLKKGKTSIVVKLRFTYAGADIENEVAGVAMQQYTRTYNHGFEIKIRSNINQMIFEIHFVPV